MGREEPAAQFNPSFLPLPLPLSFSFFALPPFPHIPLAAPWLVDHYADLGRGNPRRPTAPKLVKLVPAQLDAAPLERGWNWPEFKLAAYIGLGNQGNWITNPKIPAVADCRRSGGGRLIIGWYATPSFITWWSELTCSSPHLCSPQPSPGSHLTEFSQQKCLSFLFIFSLSWRESGHRQSRWGWTGWRWQLKLV